MDKEIIQGTSTFAEWYVTQKTNSSFWQQDQEQQRLACSWIKICSACSWNKNVNMENQQPNLNYDNRNVCCLVQIFSIWPETSKQLHAEALLEYKHVNFGVESSFLMDSNFEYWPQEARKSSRPLRTTPRVHRPERTRFWKYLLH